MTTIMLVCAAGMSTSMLVTRMEKSAEEQGIETNIFAAPASEVESILDDKTVDVLLLGPQVSFMKKRYEKLLPEKGIPFDVIDMVAYGTMDGDAVLKTALELIKD